MNSPHVAKQNCNHRQTAQVLHAKGKAVCAFRIDEGDFKHTSDDFYAVHHNTIRLGIILKVQQVSGDLWFTLDVLHFEGYTGWEVLIPACNIYALPPFDRSDVFYSPNYLQHMKGVQLSTSLPHFPPSRTPYPAVSEELLMQARTSSIFTAVGPLKFPAQTETALPGPAKIYKAWQPAIHYQNTNGQSLELCLAIALSPFLPPSPVLLEALIWSISSAKGAISHPPTSYPHGPPEPTGQFGKG